MKILVCLCVIWLILGVSWVSAKTPESIIKPESFKHYIEKFNRLYPEEVVNYVRMPKRGNG